MMSQDLSCTNITVGYLGQFIYNMDNCTGPYAAQGYLYGECTPDGNTGNSSYTTSCNSSHCINCAYPQDPDCEGDAIPTVYPLTATCQHGYYGNVWWSSDSPWTDFGAGWAELYYYEVDVGCTSDPYQFTVFGDQYCDSGEIFFGYCSNGNMNADFGCPPGGTTPYTIYPQYCVAVDGATPNYFSQFCVDNPTTAPTANPTGPATAPTSAPVAAPIAAPVAVPTAAPSGSNNSTTSSSSGADLTGGAVAGISVAVVVVVAAAALVVFLWFKRAGHGGECMKQGLVGGNRDASEVGMSSSSYVPPQPVQT